MLCFVASVIIACYNGNDYTGDPFDPQPVQEEPVTDTRTPEIIGVAEKEAAV